MLTNKMWGGVFSASVGELMQTINASISFDKLLYKHDIAGSIAHARMLTKQNILTKDEFNQIEKGLLQIQQEIDNSTFLFSEALEDIHMNIESRLVEIIGSVGKKLHTARSRNDQVVTDFKLFTIEKTKEVQILLTNVLNSFALKAEKHLHNVMPAFTHLQIAQPVSVGHYFLAYFEMFKRDLTLANNFLEEFQKECPLGAGALAGTTYNIDRTQTSKELNFNAPTKNSLDTVSDRDFAMDFLYLASRIGIHMSRFAEEMILFATTPFGFINFSDAYSTGSSIMPQKKNPDAAELLRGKTGRLIGNLNTLMIAMKGLPLAYSKDMQEDKEPLFDSASTITICLRILDGIINDISLDVERMSNVAKLGYSNATDFADYLVQKLNIPFRDAHHITGNVVALAMKQNIKLEELSLEDFQSFNSCIKSDVFDVISINSVVSRRNSYGGTGFQQVEKQISNAKKFLQSLTNEENFSTQVNTYL